MSDALSDLARVKAIFQRVKAIFQSRAVCAAMGIMGNSTCNAGVETGKAASGCESTLPTNKESE